MDVRVYPAPPQPLAAPEHPRLGQFSSYPELSFGNKLDGDTMFLGMPDTGLDFGSANQFRVPQPPPPPNGKQQTLPNTAAQHWRRDTHSNDTQRLPWSYSVVGLGDEDFNIPPITPEHMLHPHLPHDSGLYHHHHPLAPQQHPHPHHHQHQQQQQHPHHPHVPPQHPYQLQGMDLAGMPGSGQDSGNSQDGGALGQDGGLMTNALSVMQQMVNSDMRFTNSQQPIEAALRPRSQSGGGGGGLCQPSQLTTINQSQLGLSGNSLTHNSPSPPGSKSATPSPSSSAHEDDNEDAFRGEKRPLAPDTPPKKPKTPKKKKRKDPNEPVKPVSAYALFFRDTQANIKAQNPNATFGEVSKIVASMWDGLGDEAKQNYKKKTETAKKEYLKQLAAYRASLVSQSYNDPSDMKPPHHLHPSASSLSSSSSSTSMFAPKPPLYSGHPGQHPQQHPSPHSLPHPHPLPPSSSARHPGMYLPYPPHPHPHPSAASPGHLPPQHQVHPQLQGLSSRGPGGTAAPRASLPHQGALSLGGGGGGGNVVAASPPPLQVSPPLHGQAHLGGLQSPHHQQGALHSPHHQQQQHQHQQHQQHQQQQQQQQQQHSGHTLGMSHSPGMTHSPGMSHSPGMTHSPGITQGYHPSLQSEYQSMGGGGGGGGMVSNGPGMTSSLDYHQLGRPAQNHHLDWSAEYHGNGVLQRDKTLFLS